MNVSTIFSDIGLMVLLFVMSWIAYKLYKITLGSLEQKIDRKDVYDELLARFKISYIRELAKQKNIDLDSIKINTEIDLEKETMKEIQEDIKNY